jgi:hypothetical protein
MKLLSALLFISLGFSVYSYASEAPEKGQSKEQVEQRLGSPVSKKSPVGEPAISSWKYNAFTVYFEKDRVIHSVKN